MTRYSVFGGYGSPFVFLVSTTKQDILLLSIFLLLHRKKLSGNNEFFVALFRSLIYTAQDATLVVLTIFAPLERTERFFVSNIQKLLTKVLGVVEGVVDGRRAVVADGGVTEELEGSDTGGEDRTS